LRFLGIPGLIFLFGLSASAEERIHAWSDSVYVMPAIEVRAEAVEQFAIREAESIAREVILPSQSPHRLPLPEEYLKEAAGLELRRYGGLGAFSTASLRGSSGQEVAVYLDGVDLRHPMSGSTLLGDLPLAGVERIEIYRGSSPGELGAGAPAGTIHVLSGDAEGRQLALGTGSYGLTRASFSTRARGPWGSRASIAATWLSSESDFQYLDRRGTNHNSEDDTLRLRRNADFRGADLQTRLSRGSTDDRTGRWLLSARFLYRENGIPGSESLPSDSTRSRRIGQDYRLGWKSGLVFQQARLEGLIWRRDALTRFLNPASETGPFLNSDETLDQLMSEGSRLRLDWYRLPFHLLLNAELQRDRFLPENLNPRKGKGYERRRETGKWSAESRLERGRVFASFAYGEDTLFDNYHGPPSLPWLPGVEKPRRETFSRFRRSGLRADLYRGRLLEAKLKANLHEGYRPPSLLELFGQDVSVEGNSNLLPELALSRDLGLLLQLEGERGELCLEVFFFDREMEQQILFLRNSQNSVRAENLQESRVRGQELSLSFRSRSWSGRLNAHWQDARDRGDNPVYRNKSLPYRSPRKVFARLARRMKWLSLFAELEYRDEVFTDRYNDPEKSLPASTLLGAGASLPLGETWRASLEVMNLADQRCEDILGYPLPGRSWTLNLEWKTP
jgi:iron complex outermembrane receptor protein